MINFIHGLPKYAVADRCTLCGIWYPKYTMRRCPCCRYPLRSKRATFPKGTKHLKHPSKDEQREKIKQAMKAGWYPLKDDIWKSVLDFRIIHKIELEEK